MRLPGLGGWREDPLWSYVYPWLVEHPEVGRPAWRAGTGSDLRLIDEAAAELGTLPSGTRVLDVPRIGEMVRVLAPGGAITGSSIVTDTGARYEPLRRVGARTGILGPMCTSDDAIRWLRDAGCDTVELRVHGALGYFRATREARGGST